MQIYARNSSSQRASHPSLPPETRAKRGTRFAKSHIAVVTVLYDMARREEPGLGRLADPT